MKALASKGMATEVVEEVNSLDPTFFMQNPTLLFQLKQVCGFCIASCFIMDSLNKSFNLFDIILYRILQPGYFADFRLNSLSSSALGIILVL